MLAKPTQKSWIIHKLWTNRRILSGWIKLLGLNGSSYFFYTMSLQEYAFAITCNLLNLYPLYLHQVTKLVCWWEWWKTHHNDWAEFTLRSFFLGLGISSTGMMNSNSCRKYNHHIKKVTLWLLLLEIISCTSIKLVYKV